MSILEDNDAWEENPYFKEHGDEWSDYTAFYVAITFCTLLGVSIIVLNLVLCCCSPYKQYWRSPDTGNRLILPIWIRNPGKQPPLTLQPELSGVHVSADIEH